MTAFFGRRFLLYLYKNRPILWGYHSSACKSIYAFIHSIYTTLQFYPQVSYTPKRKIQADFFFGSLKISKKFLNSCRKVR